MTEKRAAVRDLYDKIKMAIDDVQYKQEKIKRKDHEGDNVSQQQQQKEQKEHHHQGLLLRGLSTTCPLRPCVCMQTS